MNSRRLLPFACAAACFVACVGSVRAQEHGLDSAKIEEITGLKGAWNKEEGVFKVSSPRADLKVSVDRWTMPPFMGLTSWAAFQKGKATDSTGMCELVIID